MQIGDRIKDLRLSLGLSRQEIADKLDVSQSTINMIERNERQPSIELLDKLADFFKVPTDYLMGKTEDKTPYNERTNIESLDSLDALLGVLIQRDGKTLTEKKKKTLAEIIKSSWRIIESQEDED